MAREAVTPQDTDGLVESSPWVGQQQLVRRAPCRHARRMAVIRMALATTERLAWHCRRPHCDAGIGPAGPISYYQNLLFSAVLSLPPAGATPLRFLAVSERQHSSLAECSARARNPSMGWVCLRARLLPAQARALSAAVPLYTGAKQGHAASAQARLRCRWLRIRRLCMVLVLQYPLIRFIRLHARMSPGPCDPEG